MPRDAILRLASPFPMTDLLHVLPDFSSKPFSNLLPSLERSRITVADILTLDAIDLARRAQVPAREVRRLGDALLGALHIQLGLDTALAAQAGAESADTLTQKKQKAEEQKSLQKSGADLEEEWNTISTLDDGLDAALSGGIPTGYVTEVTGERYALTFYSYQTNGDAYTLKAVQAKPNSYSLSSLQSNYHRQLDYRVPPSTSLQKHPSQPNDYLKCSSPILN